MNNQVIAVSTSPTHDFSKENQPSIRLRAGYGIEGDTHAGETVQHRSRVARDPSQPNLRQVHLIHGELFADLAKAGFAVQPGQMGENITTGGIDLLGLPTGTKLHIGPSAVVEVTGLRNPCNQINTFQPGLLKEVVEQDTEGNLVRKAGVMGIVLADGEVAPGDLIKIELPAEPHEALRPV